MFKKIYMTAWLALLLACCQLAAAATLSVSATPASSTAPAGITLSITLADNPEGAAVTGVEYFNGSSSLGVAGSAPFQLTLTDVAAGTYAIMARATLDSADHPVLVSDALALTINPAPGGAVAYFIHTDQISTPRAITNAAGALVWQWDSDPFGVAAPMEQPAGQAPFVHNLRFPGQYYDRETNLFYNGFRDLDPQTGRYIESDPVGLFGGINTYAYGLNNPISNIDPLGLFVPPGLPPSLMPEVAPALAPALANPIVAVAGGAFTAGLVTYQACHKDDDNDEECKKLIAEIYQVMNTVEGRLSDLYVDSLNLYNLARTGPSPSLPKGSGSWNGHITQATGWLTRLRNLVDRATKLGCKVPPYARDLANAPIPSRPALPPMP